eukprot:SAG22_NODE_136_length_18095_cov_19.897255_23_plen_94_part_00
MGTYDVQPATAIGMVCKRMHGSQIMTAYRDDVLLEGGVGAVQPVQVRVRLLVASAIAIEDTCMALYVAVPFVKTRHMQWKHNERRRDTQCIRQ